MVSVVVPCYNPGERLLEALESIRTSGLASAEVVVVDDGSSEPLPDLSAYDVRLLRQTNAGPAAARNAGWRAARNDFLAFLDADDLWLPGSQALLQAALAERPECEIAQGRIERARLDPDAPPGPRRWTSQQPYYSVNLGVCLFRRSLLERLEGFEESMRYGEDSDFFVRAWHAEAEKVRIEETVLRYQLHSANMTLHGPDDRKTVLLLMHRQFKRLQAGGKSRPGKGLIDYLGWETEPQAGFSESAGKGS